MISTQEVHEQSSQYRGSDDETYPISPHVPYQSHTVEIFGSKIHYLDEGKGDPIVFFHGIPTSSYLWRNVIPLLSQDHRCIAPDLIGMGKSDKPAIDYTVREHIHYMQEFIKTLNLRKATFVMHAWGSVIGFTIAMQNPERIKALAFLESHIRPIDKWEMLSLPVQTLASLLETVDGGYDVIMNSNYYINRVLPTGVLRTLTKTEMDHYREPFKEPGSCKPIWQYLQDLPLGRGTNTTVELIRDYSTWLEEITLPKLMLYAIPGFITTVDTIKWARDHLNQLTLIDIGDALHYAQESNPRRIGSEIKHWLEQLSRRS